MKYFDGVAVQGRKWAVRSAKYENKEPNGAAMWQTLKVGNHCCAVGLPWIKGTGRTSHEGSNSCGFLPGLHA